MPKISFDDWMREVDKYLVKRCGMDHRDLPDWRYRDDYDDGRHPRASANSAFKYAKDG